LYPREACPSIVGFFDMSYARRVDNTHAVIREALRRAYGREAVLDTHATGNGFPDLVLGVHGRTYLVEVKTPTRADGVSFKPSIVSERQRQMLRTWPGDRWLIVTGPEHALVSVAEALAQMEKQP
jgi:hypothetical protein